MRSQTDDIINFFFLFFLNLSQGFINKSSYKSQDTHSSIQISNLTEPMLMCLREIIQTSEVSLIQHVSQKIQNYKDMQCSHVKQTNDIKTTVTM
jgi:hypothetical protein